MEHISPSGRRGANLWRRVDLAADTDRPQPTITLTTGGSLTKLRAAKIPRPSSAPARRGKITGFSAAARKRLIELLASLNRKRLDRLPLFVTLTYPRVWPDEPTVWKRHLDTWLKRLERKYERTAVIWKLEFQSRGAPHFHLLVFGPRWIDAKWLSRSWYQVVDSGDINHLKAGTKVERIRSWKGVMFYASKYLAKKTDERLPGMVGRYWGILNRDMLPFDLIELPLTFGQFFRLRRLLIKWDARRDGAIRGLQTGGRKRYRHRIRYEHSGLALFVDIERVLPLLRVLAQ